MYRKYMHVERLSGAFNPEIAGLLDGQVWVFPKLDGANHSVFWDAEKGCARCGSRNQILSEGYDTTGFYKYFTEHPELAEFVEKHKNLILYGEFMTPHTIRTYDDSVWNRYFVFDVFDKETERYIHYLEYTDLLKGTGIEYVPYLTMHEGSPSLSLIEETVNMNNYMMQDGHIGEGVVVKNYDFVNQYGRTTWGKMVREEFKRDSKLPGKGHVMTLEESIAEKHVSKEFVSKEFHKFMSQFGTPAWNDGLIPDFLKYTWHEWWIDYSFETVAQGRNAVDILALRKAVSRLFVSYMKQITKVV